MTNRSVVLVSRELEHGKPITITVQDSVLGIELALDDFLAELATAYGSPVTTLTVAQHASKLQQAAGTVVDGMKAETVRVM